MIILVFDVKIVEWSEMMKWEIYWG